MARSRKRQEWIPGGFRRGDRVMVYGSTTSPSHNDTIGVVDESSAKYPNRVGVQFYVDRRFHTVYFWPSELAAVEE